jgi:hypothetical protein
VIVATQGNRDQENHGTKPAGGNSLQDPIPKTPNTKKRADRAAQVVEHLSTHHDVLSSTPVPQNNSHILLT